MTETFENNDRLLFRGVAVTFSNTCCVLCPTRADKGKRPYFVFACVMTSYTAVYNSSQRRAGQDTVEMAVEGKMYIYIFQPLHMKSMLK